MKAIYYGLTGIPLALFVDSWIADHYANSAARTQKEARAAIDRVVEYFPTLDDLTIRNRQRWLKSDYSENSTKALSFVRSHYSWLRRTSMLVPVN